MEFLGKRSVISEWQAARRESVSYPNLIYYC